MAKETHNIRIWATRGDHRELEFSRDSPSARADGLARVEGLRRDPSVDIIEMEEDVLLAEEADGPVAARRGSLRWQRSRNGWRRSASRRAR
jgi:hypothetical protein